jgi:hypothetical protein
MDGAPARKPRVIEVLLTRRIVAQCHPVRGRSDGPDDGTGNGPHFCAAPGVAFR